MEGTCRDSMEELCRCVGVRLEEVDEYLQVVLHRAELCRPACSQHSRLEVSLWVHLWTKMHSQFALLHHFLVSSPSEGSFLVSALYKQAIVDSVLVLQLVACLLDCINFSLFPLAQVKLLNPVIIRALHKHETGWL